MKYYKNRDWLYGKYWMDKLSIPQIALIIGMSCGCIRYWILKFNIPTRSTGEAGHWRRCNHCKLSEEAIQWINGELLGDGCLRSRSSYSAYFSYTSKYHEYIQYVSDTLKSFGIEQVGKIRKYYHKKYDCYSYNYCSLDYVELLPIRKQWYPNGKKIIPRDIVLTPLTLCHHYLGDGYLKRPKDSKPCIILATYDFPIPDVKWLNKELVKLGFESKRQNSDNSIRISVHSTKAFLNYIGDSPVECYNYKWNY